MSNIPSLGDFGISSTFDAVLRYLPIFFAVLRYLSIFSAILRCSATPNVPLSHGVNNKIIKYPVNMFYFYQ